MPLAPVVAQHLTTEEVRDVSLFIGGRDFTNLLDVNASSIEESASSARSLATMSLRIEMAAAFPEIIDQAFVQLVDHAADAVIFGGFIRSRHPSSGMKPMLELIADDVSVILDDTFVPWEDRPAESLPARLARLWPHPNGGYLSGYMGGVAAIGGTLPAQQFIGMTVRQMIEHAISQASAEATYYVDPSGALQVFTTSAFTAPFDVVVGTPAGGEIAPEDLDIDYDTNSYANRVYVQGATPEGSGFFQNDAAMAAANGLVRTASIQAPDCDTEAMARALALMYLGRVGQAIARGSFTTSSPYDGWRAGQTVTITEPNIGLSAVEFLIVRVTTRFQKTRTSYRRHYTVEFGGARGGGYVQ